MNHNLPLKHNIERGKNPDVLIPFSEKKNDTTGT